MRFALAVSSVFAVAAVLAGGVAYVLQSDALARQLANDVRASAESVVQMATDGDAPDLAEAVRERTRVLKDGTQLFIFLPAGGGPAVGNAALAQPFEGARRLVPGQGLTLTTPPPGQPPDSYFAYGIRMPAGWVIAARGTDLIVAGREVLMQSTAWGLGLALALSVAFAVFIARRNEARIARMEQVLDAVGTGRTDLRIHETGSDDLARLAARVDTTLDRLEAGVAAIRQVSTDVAHDLRAPLARLRMRLEPQALDTANPEALRHEIGAALADLDGISATFDAILRLSRLQSGAVELAREPVDLGALAVETHEILAPAAEDAGHRLDLVLPDRPVIATGDRELLSQAVVNLVDNALRHCPTPARVELGVGLEHGRPVVSVCDDGPGIAAEDRARVTDRFVRLDASRKTGGTGLGLSLVATIARLHGAALRLDDNTPGLCARIVFSDTPNLSGR
jgi:signal transduction histidine kinase